MKDFGISQEDIKLIQDSFGKVCDTNCWELLYKKLFELDKEIPALFKGDMKDQQHRIMTMMKIVVEGLNHPEIIIPAIQKMGLRHVEYGVYDKYYLTFKSALIYALEQTLGTDFTPNVKKSWEKFYDLLASTMNEQ